MRAAIRRMKTQFPDNPTVHLLDAELLSQSGDVEQAKRILTSLIGDPQGTGMGAVGGRISAYKAKN